MAEPTTSAVGSNTEMPLHEEAKYKKPPSKTMAASSVPSGTLTPTSTPSRSSFSATSSPMLLARSRPSSPDLGPTDVYFDSLELPDGLAPLTLPNSPPASVPTSPPTAMAEAYQISRGTGLIRRLSRGATSASNKLRGRQIATAVLNRDQRSGSMIRHRSDSRGFGDASYDISDFELDQRDDDTIQGLKGAETLEGLLGPTRSMSQRSLGRESRFATTMHDPDILLCTFTRVTEKKKRKPFTLSMDKKAAKLFWSTSHRKQLYFDDIRDLRDGEKARRDMESNGYSPEELMSRWLTIAHICVKERHKTMHLIAPDEATKKIWRHTLNHEIRQRAQNMAGITGYSEKVWLAQWKRITGQTHSCDPLQVGSATMEFADIKRVCRQFAINKSEKDLRRQFDEVDPERTGKLYSNQYLDFFRCLTARTDVRALFEKVKTSPGPKMGIEDFLKFLTEEQGVDALSNPAYWKSIFELFNAKRRHFGSGEASEGSDDDGDVSAMSFESFRDFLYSQHNEPLLGGEDQPFLDRPLNEYFISSSHNTYLKGRQFRGETDPEAYIGALKKGCRCIEIDCWDGSDGTPQVTHGRTLSSRVPFLDCIKVIKDYAFLTSDYPLILSLEVHCNDEQQAVMADILKMVFQEMLVLEELDPGSPALPSPEQLKGKVLIKVKKPKQSKSNFLTPEPTVSHRRQRSASAPNPMTGSQQYPLAPNGSPSAIPIPTIAPAAHTSTFPIVTPSGRSSLASRPDFADYSSSEETTDSDDEDRTRIIRRGKPSTSKIIPVLGNMGVYTRSVRFLDLKHPESKLFNHIYSLHERKFAKVCENTEMRKLLHKHNLRYLMRVYPHAKRYDSGNFNPLQFWRHGTQMVATNWQTRDLGSEINDAMFAGGPDETGYVLKPEELRTYKDEKSTDPKRKATKKQIKFSVEIISAQSLEPPYSLNPDVTLNPYIELEMYSAEDQAKGLATATGGTDASAKHGKSGLGSPVRRRTNIVWENGYDPIFNQTVELSLKTKYPGLVFVRWTVRHSSDGKSYNGKEPLGAFTAKLSSLAEGYRHIPLQNRGGEEIHSKLFCRIKKEEYQDVPDTAVAEPEEQSRASRAYLKRVFNRTLSDRKKSKEPEDGFNRVESVEKEKT